MPRIRTIKPEFFDDEKLSRVSRDARLTFIGMLVYSDDYGVVKGNPRWLRSMIFPYDDIPLQTFEGWLAELEDLDFIRQFAVNGENYLYIRNFKKHQVIDRPSKSRNPEPPEEVLTAPAYRRTLYEASTNTHRGRDEDSPNTRRILAEGSTNALRGLDEGSLMEKEKEREREEEKEVRSAPPPTPDGSAEGRAAPESPDSPPIFISKNKEFVQIYQALSKQSGPPAPACRYFPGLFELENEPAAQPPVMRITGQAGRYRAVPTKQPQLVPSGEDKPALVRLLRKKAS